MIKWNNESWINNKYLDDLRKYQLIESFRRDPEKLFKIIEENEKMREELIELKRQVRGRH
jgi:hypothetical protein